MNYEELLKKLNSTNDIEEINYLLKQTKWNKIPYYYLAKVKDSLNRKKIVQDVPNFKVNIVNVIIYFSLLLINPSTSILVCILEMFLASTLGKIIALLKPDIFMEKGEPEFFKILSYHRNLQKLDNSIDLRRHLETLDYTIYKNESEQFNRGIYTEEKKENSENEDTMQNILLVEELNKCLEEDDLAQSLNRFKSILENVKNENKNLNQNMLLLVQYFVLIIEKHPNSDLTAILTNLDDYFLIFLGQYICQITDSKEKFLSSIIGNKRLGLITCISAIMEINLQTPKKEPDMNRHRQK